MPIQAICQLPLIENCRRGRSVGKVRNQVGEVQFFPHGAGYLDFEGKVGVMREISFHGCPDIFFMLKGLGAVSTIMADYPK